MISFPSSYSRRISPQDHAALTSSTPASFASIPPILRHQQDNVTLAFSPIWEGYPEDGVQGTLYVTEESVYPSRSMATLEAFVAFKQTSDSTFFSVFFCFFLDNLSCIIQSSLISAVSNFVNAGIYIAIPKHHPPCHFARRPRQRTVCLLPARRIRPICQRGDCSTSAGERWTLSSRR